MIARTEAEAEAILGALVKRVTRIELTSPAVVRLVNTLRNLDRLPLRPIA